MTPDEKHEVKLMMHRYDPRDIDGPGVRWDLVATCVKCGREWSQGNGDQWRLDKTVTGERR